MFQRVLICLDGSPFAELALPVAIELALGWSSTLIMYRSVPPPPLPAFGTLPANLADEPIKAALKEAESYLHALSQSLPLELPHETLTRVGTPVQTLKTVVSEHRVDLIVIATHHRHGLARWLSGSTTGNLLQDALCPLLSLPYSENDVRPK